MTKVFLTLSLAFFATFVFAQEVKKDEAGFEYFELADGDTTYIMKKYFFVMLNSGPTRSLSKEETAEIQKGHLAHIGWMGEQGYVTWPDRLSQKMNSGVYWCSMYLQGKKWRSWLQWIPL